MSGSAEIDFDSIRKKILTNSEVKQRILDTISESVERKKQDFLDEFENHPVTAEILGGESSSNLSGTLGGYGNLFSFIGFDSSDEPVGSIRNLFKKK